MTRLNYIVHITAYSYPNPRKQTSNKQTAKKTRSRGRGYEQWAPTSSLTTCPIPLISNVTNKPANKPKNKETNIKQKNKQTAKKNKKQGGRL